MSGKELITKEKAQELAPVEPRAEITPTEWGLMKEQAAMLIKSQFIPAALNTPEKVIAVMLTAKELNIGKMEALRSVNIIQGKPCMSAQLMLALAQRTKEVADMQILEDDDGAHVTIQRKGQKPYTSHFGPSQAKSLGLDGKDNYRKQAGTMYKWRALAEAVRFTFPDAVCGLYTPEELGAPVIVTAEGEVVIDMPAAPKPADKPSGADRLLNDAEIKLLHAKITDWAKATGESDAEMKTVVKAYCKEHFGKETSKDLTVSELSDLLKWMKAQQEPPAAAE